MSITLVTGANGFVGESLCVEMRQKGRTIVEAVRFKTALNDDSNRTLVGSINGTTDWSVALRNIDAVIHLAARVHVMDDKAVDPLANFRIVNVDGSLNLARQAAQAGIRRFIFISSIKVNGEHTLMGKPFIESDAENPQDAYGISKFEAEQGLLHIAQQTNMEVVIIRSPLVYGPGVKANFASLMRAVKNRVPLPFGAISNKRSFVYVGNLVSLIEHCIDHAEAANQVFLVSDGHDLSTTDLLRECALALGVKPRLLLIPQSWLEAAAKLIGKQEVAQRLFGNLQVDITKSYTLLGWNPPISVRDGLKVTAQSLIKD